MQLVEAHAAGVIRGQLRRQRRRPPAAPHRSAGARQGRSRARRPASRRRSPRAHANARGRGPSSRMMKSVSSSTRACGIRHVVESREDRPEHVTSERAAVDRLAVPAAPGTSWAPRARPASACHRARRPASGRRRTAARASRDYNSPTRRDFLSVETSVRVPALMNIATRLRIDSVRSTSEAGSGHPSTCCSAAEIVAALFFAEMRYDPRDPQNPDNDRFVLSKGHARADSVRRLGRGRVPQTRGSAHAAAARFGSRRASDAASAVCRRRDRLSGPGSCGRCRHRAQRPPHQLRLPHLRAARRRRDRRRIGLGSGQRRRPPTSSTRCAASPTSTRSARAVRRSGSTIRSRLPHDGAHSAGTSSRWTATTCWRFSTRSRRRGRPAAGRR